MAIVNRDCDVSQQDETHVAALTKTITGQTYSLMVAPFPCQLIAAQQCAAGLSGAPNHSLWLQRFLPGVGITSIAVGASLVSQVWGTSGSQSYTIAAAATSYPMQAGDLLMLSTAAANTSCEQVQVSFVIRALQDIKSFYGTV